MHNRTFAIIKPDAVKNDYTGLIYDRIIKSGFKILGAKLKKMTKDEANEFYLIHKDKPFYVELVEYMISGPVIVQVLEGEQAIKRNRDVMGATNPAEAAAGTIRADFAESVQANAVHGSDGPTTAQQEISYFFEPANICSRK